MENNRTPYNSNVNMTAPYNLSGRDSVRQESSLNTIGNAEKTKVASPNYSKRLLGSLPNSHLCGYVSLLSDLR